jgi:predicted ATPase with chaperone activity
MKVKLSQLTEVKSFRKKEVKNSAIGWRRMIIRKRQEKRWGTIFTCLNSRAIHIELASSLSTDSAIMAIKKEVSWKNRCIEEDTIVITRQTFEVLRLQRSLLELDCDRLNCEFAEADIKWKFKTP